LFILAVIGFFGAGIGGAICESSGYDSIGAMLLFCAIGAVTPIFAALALIKTGLLKNDAQQQAATGQVSDAFVSNDSGNQSESPASEGKRQVKSPRREIALGLAFIVISLIWVGVCGFIFYTTWNEPLQPEQLGLESV
jgi:hypothetical protein